MKKLSIEEKAKAYDEAKYIMKEYLESGNAGVIAENTIKKAFPELAESEDERIRKDIIVLVEDWWDRVNKDNISTKEQMIAWLEKQKQDDLTNYKKTLSNYDEAEKEKCDFVGDGFIKCYADFQDFKEGETYWFEYIGDDKYNVRSDNLLGKTYHITPCQLYTIFKKQTWLEKQGEQKSNPCDGCVNRKGCINCENGELRETEQKLETKWNKNTEYNKPQVNHSVLMYTTHGIAEGEWKGDWWHQYRWSATVYDREVIAWMELTDLEKQGKHTNKVNPKFHEGQWITNGDYTWKIVEVKHLDYILQSQDGNIVDDTISHVDEQFHLWTIKDTKKYDVLYCKSESEIEFFVIYKCINEHNNVDSYFRYSSWDGFGVDIPSVLSAKYDTITPATKEQCQFLFQKMKEAGYEWDAVNKELKKISQRMISAEAKEAMYDKPACVWSEEDERILDALVTSLNNEYFTKRLKTLKGIGVLPVINWLKSLKERIKLWKQKI